METIPGQTIQLLSIASLLLALAGARLPQANAAQILYVVNTVVDPATAANANDQEVRDRLTGQGHIVTLADDQDPALGDMFAGKDLILISSSVGSANQPLNSLSISDLRTGRIPIVDYEPGLYDELLFQRENTFGNAGGHTSLAISAANQGHPLAAGKSGVIDIVNVGAGDTATVSSSALPYTVGTNAIIIATNATVGVDEGHICVWAYEKASRLADDNTVVPSRRVAFFYNASTPAGIYNTNATALFDAAIAWALLPPPNLPITVIWRSPPSQNSAPDPAIVAELEDGSSTQVNTNSILLSLNGAAVTASVSRTGTITTVSFTPTTIFAAGSSNKLALLYSDNGNPAQMFTNTFQFTVENYVTLLPDVKLSVASIDRSKPGYTVKLRQMDVARPGGNNIATVRMQLNDGFIDPNTGQPYQDVIDRSQTGFETGSGFNADGTFTESGVINYNQAANGVGAEMGVFVAPDFPDKLIPGIPGITSSTDNIALQARTVLELKAGLYRLAVNSDDGFAVTVGLSPEDVFALRAGAFDADRGQGTTEFSIAVSEDGLYPFELIWWESGGGAEVEFFSVNHATSQRTLINDAASTNAIKAFRPPASIFSLPTITSLNPRAGAVGVPKNTTLDITIQDGTVQVVTNSIQLMLNGAAVTPSITRSGALITVSFDPPSDLPTLSVNTATFVFSDNASPAHTRTNSWSFVVESALPKALFIVANPAALNASDAAVKARLETLFGFEVVAVGDAASQTSDTTGKTLIVNSSTVGSGNVNTKFQTVAVPLLTWEQALQDDYLFTLDSATDHGGTAAQTDIIITDATHPLAAGLSTGTHTVVNGPATFSWGLPASSAKVVATLADGTGSACLYAFETGALLIDGVTTAPARRVHIFLDNDTFALLNTDGLKLFDAAVKWAAKLPIEQPFKFNPPVISGTQVTITWTISGTLQEATQLTGNASDWSNVTPQPTGNTFTVTPGTVPKKFYRLRQ